MRILAVDPGEKRLGLAISDPSGTIANPLATLKHRSRDQDADQIVQIAAEYHVERIVVGQALDETGQPTLEGRRAARLAGAIRTRTTIPVDLWDESGSTQEARAGQITLGVRRSKRRGHLDSLAATVILQSYLDARQVR